MHYVHGKGQIIPGLEKELAGMPVGAEKKVTVKPEEAYGPVDPKAFQEIPEDNSPKRCKSVRCRRRKALEAKASRCACTRSKIIL